MFGFSAWRAGIIGTLAARANASHGLCYWTSEGGASLRGGHAHFHPDPADVATLLFCNWWVLEGLKLWLRPEKSGARAEATASVVAATAAVDHQVATEKEANRSSSSSGITAGRLPPLCLPTALRLNAEERRALGAFLQIDCHFATASAAAITECCFGWGASNTGGSATKGARVASSGVGDEKRGE